MAAGQMTQQQLAAANAQARANILSFGVPRLQNIFSQAVTPSATGAPVNVNVQNVGLIRGFLVRVKGSLHNSGSGTANLSEFGAANVLSNITFNDFNNIQRINTTGFHMSMLNSAKQDTVFGGAYSPNVPVSFGNNWTVQSAPATVATTANGALTYFYYVPLAYSKSDLRGSVYAGLVNATAFLGLTINPNPFVAAGDFLSAIYTGQAGVWQAGTQVQIDVYQDYIDQLPMQNGQAVLPPLDISTIYDLKYTSTGAAITANQNYGIGYANFRTFLSTMLIVDNGGTYNVGSDINYFALQAANSTNFWQYTPDVAALLARSIFMADPPSGVYWFDTRDRPINTQQYGNVQLVVNMSTVNANPALLVGYEQFDLTQTIQIMSSLPSG
jgi:P3 major capsid protein